MVMLFDVGEALSRFGFTLNQAMETVLFELDTMSGGEIFVPKVTSRTFLI